MKSMSCLRGGVVGDGGAVVQQGVYLLGAYARPRRKKPLPIPAARPSLAGEVLDVVHVLLPQHGQVAHDAWQVAVLALPQLVGAHDEALELLPVQDLRDLGAGQ
jgi:hypothetical protein